MLIKSARPIVGAFDYTYLIFAIAWGALLFDEELDGRMRLVWPLS
ncbi:hypothetical protein [Pseudomonas citrulli]|uniref:Uncharacterized protein n=1 Tax=Pseudomonas citrulli TaxID=3064347 RepID=A0ABT9BYA3_9PSED|nr:hypothetical protein [Pseudomonas sp. K18]MDO7897530.1 hypothetical protein [Pseudomonas sp. K18]